MISAAFINSFFRKHILLFLILIGATIFRFGGIESAFQFDHDEAVPAEAAYSLFIEGKISLIGQELSAPGLFLGPFHNWLHFIPYYACNLSPACVPYFFALLSILTIAFAYLMLSEIFGKKTAALTLMFYSLSFTAITLERSANSNFLIFPVSVTLLYTIYKYYKGNDTYLILGGFLSGFATVNSNPVFVFSSVAFFLHALLRKNLSKKIYIVSILLFASNYLPLIFFNFRHDNILLAALIEFLRNGTGSQELPSKVMYVVYNVFLPFSTHFIFAKASVGLILSTALFLILSIPKVIEKKDKALYFLISWPLVVIVCFIFYRGHVSDYYFQQTTLPVLILVAHLLKNYKVLATFVVLLVLAFNVHRAVTFGSNVNFLTKNAIVNFIINDTAEKSYNVYYQMPPGINTGYTTLFKLKNSNSVENQENLYIVEYSKPEDFSLDNYSHYAPKNINVYFFNSFVKVISVK